MTNHRVIVGAASIPLQAIHKVVVDRAKPKRALPILGVVIGTLFLLRVLEVVLTGGLNPDAVSRLGFQLVVGIAIFGGSIRSLLRGGQHVVVLIDSDRGRLPILTTHDAACARSLALSVNQTRFGAA